MKNYEKAIAVINEVKKVVVGKEECIVKTMCALLAGGHVLLEDIPGVGKTTMAKAFVRSMQLTSNRMQFTPDVMPSDIVGFKLYRPNTQTFEYQNGAVLCNLFLGDEINRTSPRTQSALLEVMEEGRVSVEGEEIVIPKPFFVIATQNPYGSAGTQRMPESQLDRFMVCLTMGYPDLEEEIAIVKGKCHSVMAEEITQVIDRDELLTLMEEAGNLYIDDKVYGYIGRLTQQTRMMDGIELGLSPRGTIAVAKMAQALAYVTGRQYVTPDDVKTVFTDVAAHRLRLSATSQEGYAAARSMCEAVLKMTPAPSVL